MEAQLQHTHGHHYDEQEPLHAGGHHTGNEDEHHGEKKSVIKKVKAKAKKLKDTITKHGHGHGGHDQHHHHDEEDDDDDEDEETVEDPEVHGAPMYDSARIGAGGPDAILAQPRGNLERPSVMAEDRYTSRSDVVEPLARHGAPPSVYGTNLSEPSGLGQPQAYGQELYPEQWRGKMGQSVGMEEKPFAPNPTWVASPAAPTYGMTDVPHSVGNRGPVNHEGLRGSIGKSTGMVEDHHAPKHPSPRVGSEPSNYETKVTDPTHTGGKEAGLSQIQHSFDKMGIRDEEYSGSRASDPKSFDPNHPENLPRETLTGNPSSRSSSYAGKISSSASAIAGKAAVAKDVIASKLGYSGQTPTHSHEGEETVNKSGSATDYAHKITDKVTETLAPVYEKVVDAGSSLMAGVKGTGTGTGQPEVQRGTVTSSVAATMEKGAGADKGVSVKEYLAEALRPGDGDKALSETITHAFHRGNHQESEMKSGEDRPPIERVTESVQVRQRLGTDCGEEQQQHSSNVSADKGVTERLRDAMGSWFVGDKTSRGAFGTSYVTDEGLSASPTGKKNTGGQ